MLLFGTVLLTVVPWVTGSAFLYFVQPTATTAVIGLVLLVSAVIGRPFAQRFAHDFCRSVRSFWPAPGVRLFFVRISLLWATVLMVNAGIVFWLLLASSLHTFVLERSAITYRLTAPAIFLSITRFVAAMRRDGIVVEWSRSRQPADPSRNRLSALDPPATRQPTLNPGSRTLNAREVESR